MTAPGNRALHGSGKLAFAGAVFLRSTQRLHTRHAVKVSPLQACLGRRVDLGLCFFQSNIVCVVRLAGLTEASD